MREVFSRVSGRRDCFLRTISGMSGNCERKLAETTRSEFDIRVGGARDIACLQFNIRETCGDLARPLRMYDIDEFHNVERICEGFDRNIKEGPGAEHDRAAAAR